MKTKIHGAIEIIEKKMYEFFFASNDKMIHILGTGKLLESTNEVFVAAVSIP